MARERSPRYPATGLSDAIELAGRLYKVEKRTPVSAELIAAAWGYKGVSGSVLGRLGALRQYGLLEGSKDGIRVSDLAVEILEHPKHSAESRNAVARAALNPPLFADLNEQLPNASDEALKAHLITKRGFSPDGARQCIVSYRDAMVMSSYVAEAKGIAHGVSTVVAHSQVGNDSIINHDVASSPGRLFPASGRTFGAAPDSLIFRIPFRGAELTVRVEVSGQKLTKEHLARVRAYLQMAADDLEPELDTADLAETPDTREES